MRAPVLKIRKKVKDIQGTMRPCVQIQAIIDDEVRQVLAKDFNEEILFKRTLFTNGIPDNMPQPEPMLYAHLSNFIKNDACPEVSVKSILSGQLYQAKDPWEVQCFEWIGQRAFDALVLLIICANEMGTETEYAPCGTDPLCDAAEEDAGAPQNATDATEAGSAALTEAA